MKVLLYMCVIIISVTLVIAVFKKITKVFLTKKDNLSCVISIVPVNNTTKDIEYIVRNLIESKKWGDSYGQYILLVLIECGNEILRLCEELAKVHDVVFTCNIDELGQIIQNSNDFFIAL